MTVLQIFQKIKLTTKDSSEEVNIYGIILKNTKQRISTSKSSMIEKN